MVSKKNPFKKNKYEIEWNLINAGLSGLLVLLGAWSGGGLTWQAVGTAIVAALIVMATKFKNYWDGEKGEYSTKVFNFIG